MIRNFEIILAKYLHGHPLRPYLWNRFVTTAKTANFKAQRVLQQQNPQIFLIFVFLSKIYTYICEDLIYGVGLSARPKQSTFKVKRVLEIQNSDFIFVKYLHGCALRPYVWIWLVTTFSDFLFQKYTQYSVKTLSIESIFHHGQNDPFSRSNDQNSEIIFAKNLHGHPLRPYLWSRLIVIAKMIHFQGQTSPKEGNSSILLIFMSVETGHGQNGPFSRSNKPQSRQTSHFANCRYSLLSFLVIQKSKIIFSKIHTDVRYYLICGAGWSPRPKRPIFKVKRAISTIFFGDPEFRDHFWSRFGHHDDFFNLINSIFVYQYVRSWIINIDFSLALVEIMVLIYGDNYMAHHQGYLRFFAYMSFSVLPFGD
uniref:Uncharacterized protein n=1 Tax=Solanum lycopersicum TaxID=4081 RepID=A0A3Q7GG31_SOLLC